MPILSGLSLEIPIGSAHKPINNCFFICYNPVSLEDTSPHWLSELRVLRAHPSRWKDVLKVGELGIQSKLFAPQGDDGIGGFLLTVWCCVMGGLYGKTVSQPFLPILMWITFLVTQCVGATQLVSGYFSQ